MSEHLSPLCVSESEVLSTRKISLSLICHLTDLREITVFRKDCSNFVVVRQKNNTKIRRKLRKHKQKELMIDW